MRRDLCFQEWWWWSGGRQMMRERQEEVEVTRRRTPIGGARGKIPCRVHLWYANDYPRLQCLPRRIGCNAQRLWPRPLSPTPDQNRTLGRFAARPLWRRRSHCNTAFSFFGFYEGFHYHYRAEKAPNSMGVGRVSISSVSWAFHYHSHPHRIHPA